jgi:DNA-binding response OmpR family regulator
VRHAQTYPQNVGRDGNDRRANCCFIRLVEIAIAPAGNLQRRVLARNRGDRDLDIFRCRTEEIEAQPVDTRRARRIVEQVGRRSALGQRRIEQEPADDDRIVKMRGQEVKLSPKEYDLLRLFVQHAGKVLTHNYLLDQLWGPSADAQYVRVYVRQLRNKIEPQPDRPEYIHTETGVGYRLRLPD